MKSYSNILKEQEDGYDWICVVYTTYYAVVRGFVYSQTIFEQNQHAGSRFSDCVGGEELEAQRWSGPSPGGGRKVSLPA